MIYNGEDCIISFLLWESCDEVHCNLLKWKGSFFGGDLIQGRLLLISKDFVLLTVGTSLDIIRYPLAHTYPFVYFGSFPNGFISFWMSSCWMIVDKGH